MHLTRKLMTVVSAALALSVACDVQAQSSAKNTKNRPQAANASVSAESVRRQQINEWTLGLAGGLASLARSIPQVEIDVDLADVRISDHVEIALYRIAQECLQNVVKHARATKTRLTFAVGPGETGDLVRLEIADNGVGFDTLEHPLGGDERGGYGLL